MKADNLILNLDATKIARIVSALRDRGEDADLVDELTDRQALEQAGATEEQMEMIISGKSR